MIVRPVIEDFSEVLKPSFIYHRPVCDDDGTLHLHILRYTKCAERLAETHLGIPKHLIVAMELFLCFLYSCILFRAKNDGILCLAHIARMKACLPMFYGCNGFRHRFKITAIPFVGTFYRVENFLLNPGTLQDTMHLLVVERAHRMPLDEYRHLSVQQRIGNPCRLGILVNTLLR